MKKTIFFIILSFHHSLLLSNCQIEILQKHFADPLWDWKIKLIKILNKIILSNNLISKLHLIMIIPCLNNKLSNY